MSRITGDTVIQQSPKKRFYHLVTELIGEIQSICDIAPQKVDYNRFLSLIRKYENISVVTDDMLYELIDRIEVHTATGGRTKYRRQQIDIYFSFIGNYFPPQLQISEEEHIKAIQAEEKKKAAEKAHRANEKRKANRAALREKAKTDEEAAKEYEALLKREAEYRKQYSKQRKALLETSQSDIDKISESDRLRVKRAIESYQKRKDKQNRKAKENRAELKERAKTDTKVSTEYHIKKYETLYGT